ncbi:hypothetical protein TRFO_22849 [Tritrichomonas foetus]|uniref:Uncharacterized protein n=1 Tax=Tritrichomonas foetus TaxID=1144522 RepID=A0A1J4KAZ5_9EUKA|nr:hypothetical protein TRFO_22849 [Tritrichomonas foetus]|eukprot:OHT08585.1 hypothetical protein TRFO_22849 [Tritrichomonas foetus]
MRPSVSTPKSPNLLQMIIRFFNNQDVSFQKIQNMVEESTTDEIVPAFAFLGAWITSNTENSEKMQFVTKQAAYNLIDLFAAKVPPVILVTGILNSKVSLGKPSVALIEHFQSFFLRLQRIAMIIHPFSLGNANIKFPANPQQKAVKKELAGFSNAHIQFAWETDPCFHDTHIESFQRLMIEHASIDRFEPILQLQNSKFILTQAIVKLLMDFNNNRKTSHKQILFMFSTLFLYIQAFAEKDQIDGQILCEYIQSSPYLSPFCLLGFINCIPKDLYLFNLLVPSKLAGKKLDPTESLKEIQNQFILVDMSLDNSLDSLIEATPNLALSYFLSDTSNFRVSNKPKTDSEIIIFIHQCGNSVSERFKEIMKLAHEGLLNSLHVAAMDLPLLRYTTFTLMKNMRTMITNGSLTKNIYDFLILSMATIMPTSSIQIAEQFFSLPITDFFSAEIYLRAIILHSLKLLLFFPIQKHIIPFAFECLKQNGPIQFYARILIYRYYCTISYYVNDIIKDCIVDCDDPIVLLGTLSYIDSMIRYQDYDEYSSFMELRDLIIKKIPFISENPNEKPFTYDSIRQSSETTHDNFNSSKDNFKDGFNGAKDGFKEVLRENSKENIKDTSKDVGKDNYNDTSKNSISINELQLDIRKNPLYSLNILTYSSKLKKNREFAQLLAKTTCEQLQNNTDPSIIKCPFVITVAEMSVPFALALMARLLLYDHFEEAFMVLQALHPFIKTDDLALNWMTPMLSTLYDHLTPRIREEFISVISTLPDAKKYFITGEDIALKTTELLTESDMSIIQDPDVIIRAYKSIPRYIFMFSIPAFLLTFSDKKTLIDNLLMPVYDTTHTWVNRERKCFFISMIASSMPLDICYTYFLRLISNPKCDIALETSRLFLTYSRLELFRKICSNSYEIIKNDDRKLYAYICMVLPNFSRLENDEDIACKMLCGILQSINFTTPRELQETVIDAVGLVYITLHLQKSRGKLINASSQFSPELRTIIASSLDIESIQRPRK